MEQQKKTASRGKMQNRMFYTAILLCVAAVGATGYMADKNKKELEAVQEQVQLEQQLQASSQQEEPAAPSMEEEETETQQEEAAAQTEQQEESQQAAAPAQKEQQKELTYAPPVEGEILLPYSAQELVYSNTMGDYRVHLGVDIKASEGANVKAAAAGTVEKIEKLELMGNTVTIDHGNGMKTVYSNLQNAILVKEGDKVEQGTVLGGVGTSAAAESKDAAHLHFEMWNKEAAVNPGDYVKEYAK